MDYRLSYLISTRNRLAFLKITLNQLLQNIQEDEEIVVVDGNSTDGTKAYLQELFNDKKIHQFVSEPDHNQAHGWNKAMLMARGTIIKKIIDDDVFCYRAISDCKMFMLDHPEVDVVISNNLSAGLYSPDSISMHSRLTQFQSWADGKQPSFSFGDVHMLIRKSALSYIGLYNTGYIMMDWEYALRISYLKANIVYFTGFNALSIGHDQTVSALKNIVNVNAQSKRANVFYEYKGDEAEIKLWSKIKIGIGKKIYSNAMGVPLEKDLQPIEVKYERFYQYINQLNSNGIFAFVNSKNS